MLNVTLADDHLHGKLLVTWLLLVMSLMVSFCAVLFPHEMSRIRSGTELSQFLRFSYLFMKFILVLRNHYAFIKLTV